jgi:sulfoacetaldehyde acetyltransferase
VLNRVILKAKRCSAPAQINMPRDFWTQVVDIELPAGRRVRAPRRRRQRHRRGRELLSKAEFPVILNGAGVVLAGAIPASMAGRAARCAGLLGYQHNDAFPGSHPLFAGPLGYNGSKAAMELISRADVVLALGTRLNPFSTLPGYGIDYWPKDAKIIQVDINPDRIGLTKKVTVGIVGDAKQGGRRDPGRSSPTRRRQGPRRAQGAIAQTKSRLGAAAVLDGSRGRRSRHHLERARPRRQARLDEPAHGLARDPVRAAEARRSSPRHRQQLRHRQRLPDLRGRPQIPRARVCSAPAAMACPPSSAPRSPARMCRSWVLPATAPSASRSTN